MEVAIHSSVPAVAIARCLLWFRTGGHRLPLLLGFALDLRPGGEVFIIRHTTVRERPARRFAHFSSSATSTLPCGISQHFG